MRRMVGAVALVFVVFGGLDAARATHETPPGCDSDMIESVAAALQVSHADVGMSSCRQDPVTTDHFIVAIVSPTSLPEQAGAEDDPERFNLDIALWNPRTLAVIARGHEAGYLLSDASSLRATSVDTGRYTLAPDTRAFGIRDIHYPYNTHSKWSETHLTLFVQHDDRIERIFTTQVELLTEDDGRTGCPEATRAIRTAISTATSHSHGYADLRLVTQATTETGSPGRPCGPHKSVERNHVSYDGTRYEPVAIKMYAHPFD